MIADLRLQHYRSYVDSLFTFHPGVNIIVGPNGSGKTNLLEALLMICVGSSYRAHDSELVGFNEPWARLDAHDAVLGLRTVKLELEPSIKKSYQLEGKNFFRLTFQHSLPVVLFEPNHLLLLSGSPDARRTYLDDLLEQTTPGFGTTRRQYKRALAQRNALLKQGPANQMLLFPWNVRLSDLAGQIVRHRHQMINQLDTEIKPLYKSLSNAETVVGIRYDSRWPEQSYETNMLQKLENNLELDSIRGFTTVGPHREDLAFSYNDHPAIETASRGETRTFILALKILELQILEAARGSRPLLLLDDVFSELDGSRRNALTNYLALYQTFITTTDADIVTQHFKKSTNIIPLTSE